MVKTGREICEKTRKILAMRKSGMSHGEIAKVLGVPITTVKKRCSKYGVVNLEPRPTDEDARRLVESTGWDYVGGYENYHSLITIRCRTCGTESQHYFRNLRDKAIATNGDGLFCTACMNVISQQRAEERRQEKQEEREARNTARRKEKEAEEAEQLSRELQERLAIHVCQNCGETFVIAVTGYDSELYCSKRCMDRYHDRIKGDRRLRRMTERVHDADITLAKLYNRDGGICYICGKKCNWNDIKPWKGTMVAGNSYPSIDHVKPLSKGGLHTWSNIKLACKECNSKKGWKYAP